MWNWSTDCAAGPRVNRIPSICSRRREDKSRAAKACRLFGYELWDNEGDLVSDLNDTGADYKLSEGLSPLARHKKDFTVVQGCSNQYSNEAHWGSTFWLTGANRYSVPGQNMANSISADQVAAQQLGEDTRFASMQLDSSDGSASGHGPGLSLAWDQRGKPVAGFNNPLQVFHKLFSADNLPLAQRQAAITEKRSVLDAVLTEARRVQRGLSKTDNDKLDEYFQGIRDIETRLGKDEDWLVVPKAKGPWPSLRPALRAGTKSSSCTISSWPPCKPTARG